MSNKYAVNYFLSKGDDFKSFWEDYLKEGDKKIFYIMGINFDPRASQCCEIIHKKLSTNSINYKIIEYDDTFQNNEKLATTLQKNITSLEKIISREKWNSTVIHMITKPDDDLSAEASQSITESELDQHTDIILDVSGMPNGVYFPIARNIFDWINKNKIKSPKNSKINFHIVVSENAEFDKRIKEIRTSDKVTYMHKFGAKLQLESTKNLRKIWIPLLGENQKVQLEKIHEEISAKEVCPIFPMPSSDPYRCKELLVKYRELLVDTLTIDPRNYVYSNELNPFETCRKIYDIAHSYYDSFKPLKGCQVVISPLSSKLLCIGALLATYELHNEGSPVGIVHVVNQTYDIEGVVDVDKIIEKSYPEFYVVNRRLL